MFCIKCGNKINDGEQFCTNCGYKVDGASSFKEENIQIPVTSVSKNVQNDVVEPKGDSQKTIRKRAIIAFVSILLLVIVVFLVMLATNADFKCSILGHKWIDATCTDAQICSVCNHTEGEALGHQWKDATCTALKTCTVCGTTEGDLASHQWQNATCTTLKTCTVCGTAEGDLASHQWQNATCTTLKTCTVCGITEGDLVSHQWLDATTSAPKTCSVCGLTEGNALTVTEIKIYPTNIEASSQLADIDGITYSPYNLTDEDLSTAYVEGVVGVGVGEYIGFNFPEYIENFYITKMVWSPGYQSSETLLEQNGYPTSLHIFDGFFNEFEYFSDINTSTPIEIGTTITYEFPEPILVSPYLFLVVEINSANAGSMYEDTCISEIEFYGYQLID